MSFLLVGRVLRESDERWGRRLILIALAEAAGDDGIAWLSQKTIADRVNGTRPHVAACLIEMAEDGVIQIRKAQRGRRRINVYRINLPALDEPHYDTLPFELDKPFDRVRNSDTVTRVPITSSDKRPKSAESGNSDTVDATDLTPSDGDDVGSPDTVKDGGGARGKDVSKPSVTARELLARYIEHSPVRVAKQVKGHLGRRIKIALDEDGYTPEQVWAGLERMIDQRLVSPHLLPNLIMEATMPPKTGGRQQSLLDYLKSEHTDD